MIVYTEQTSDKKITCGVVFLFQRALPQQKVSEEWDKPTRGNLSKTQSTTRKQHLKGKLANIEKKHELGIWKKDNEDQESARDNHRIQADTLPTHSQT